MLPHLALVLLGLAVCEKEDPLQVGRPRHRGVGLVSVHVIESPVEDGSGVIDAGALEVVAGSGAVVDEVLLRHRQGHSHFAFKEGFLAPPV